jgi:hypothetical protein
MLGHKTDKIAVILSKILNSELLTIVFSLSL